MTLFRKRNRLKRPKKLKPQKDPTANFRRWSWKRPSRRYEHLDG